MKDEKIEPGKLYVARDPFDSAHVRVRVIDLCAEMPIYWRCAKDDGSIVLIAAHDFISSDE
jgi:hypothetical protein